MDERIEQAKKWITIYTGNYPRRMFWALTGNTKRSVRKHILEVLLGEKVKCGQEGITRLKEELFRAYNVQGNCLAAQEDDLFTKMNI